MIDRQRRRTLLGLAGLLVPALTRAGRSLEPTPSQTPGPFYPLVPPLDDDNDLTRVAGISGRASGEITDLRGQLLDGNGRPLGGVRVEIWQCDANGRYRHPWDRGGREPDPAFQGYGHALTDAAGRYRFRTIRPVPYPGRTPHIHVGVFPQGADPFTTQLYVAGETGNEGDRLYGRIPAALRHLVTAEFAAVKGPEALLRAEFDIVLGVLPPA